MNARIGLGLLLVVLVGIGGWLVVGSLGSRGGGPLASGPPEKSVGSLPGHSEIAPAAPGIGGERQSIEAGVAVGSLTLGATVRAESAHLGDDPAVMSASGAALDVHVVDPGGGSTEGAKVRLVAPADLDEAGGDFEEVEPTRRVDASVHNGVARYEDLTPHTDLVLEVRAPSPLGALVLRARTPGPGERARIDARFPDGDVVLLGQLLGALPRATWTWALWDPLPPEDAPWHPDTRLHVDDDGRFVVRADRERWSILGPAACLVILRDGILQEALELPPLVGPGVYPLAAVDTEVSFLASGRVVLESEGDVQSTSVAIAGNRPPGEPGVLYEAQALEPEPDGSFLLLGRVPTHWNWQFVSLDADWEVVEPAAFRPGAHNMEVRLTRVNRRMEGRLVPSDELDAFGFWAEHFLVAAVAHDGSRRMHCLLESDGTFRAVLPMDPATVREISITAKWNGQEVFTWPVDPSEPTVVLLPKEVRIVTLDVRGEDGEPVRAVALDPATLHASPLSIPARAPLRVLLDGTPRDVLVRAVGHRDALVTALTEDRRIDLEPGRIPLRLLLPDWPALPDGYRAHPILSPTPDGRTDLALPPPIDSQGAATLFVPEPGTYYVHLRIERLQGHARSHTLLDGPDSPQIQIPIPLPNAPPPEFTIHIPATSVLAAVEALR